MRCSYDVCVIGGGILGCMMTRELAKYQLHTLLLEQEEDVCMGITKANSAVIYAGYDHKCNTQKSGMCVRGNSRLEELCEELDVSFERKGSIMLGFGPKSEAVLQKKLEQGKRNQVPGIELLDQEEICALEPFVNPAVTRGLYAQTTATVNPWELGIAAFENALENGLEVSFRKKVIDIRKSKTHSASYEIEMEDVVSGTIESIQTYGILNCAGVYADEIRNMLLAPRYIIKPTKASFLVFSKYLRQQINHILFYEPEEDRKGITLVPTTDGSLLAGGTLETAFSKNDAMTEKEGLEALFSEVKFLIPQIDTSELIHNFAGVRPNPWEADESERSIPGFVIDTDPACPGMVSMIGIKTPGLTCSQELAEHVVQLLVERLPLIPKRRADFRGERKSSYRGKGAKTGKVLCHCNQVTEGEIRMVVQMGVTTWEGIKHRCFTGMGRCQGSRCRSKVMKIVEEQVRKR